ncbi:MAG: nodulation protein NfeD [Alphaproteobacteria bacterium]|nr:nodulation protein NfeD [Alphaproteobacteria bacterium]
MGIAERGGWALTRARAWFFLLLAALTVLSTPGALAASRVGVIDLDGPIGPASAAHVKRSFSELQSHDIDLVVLRLDTPGGLVKSMRAIIKDILASKVPVVGFVAPRGAHAASAGTYILYATHIAAMAPATNLGAATPIRLGDDPSPGQDEQNEAESEKTPTVEDKILSDAIAYIRSLAELRGRNADWAERAVRQAASLPAGEALKLGVINLVAGDLTQLLVKLDGIEVELEGETVILDLADREIVELEPSLHTRFLSVITDPTIAYGLLMVGMIGILVEVAIPGLFLPGMVGLVSLLLSLYAFQLLPVSLVGLGIIILGVILMIVELTMVGFGFVGMSGIIAFVLGSVFLMDTGVPGYGISKPMIGLIAVISSSLLMAFLVWIRRLHSMPMLGGPEELLGGTATVEIWQGDEGRVSMRGTTWAARSSGTLSPGQRVRVVAVDGLTVDVEPESEKAIS